MNITRYEPWNIVTQLQREIERSFNPSRNDSTVATAEWTPAVDIKEEPDRYVLHTDLPGVQPEDIDVTMEDGVLAIKGARPTEAKSESEGFKRVERTYGSFYRRFALPDTADADAGTEAGGSACHDG